jgi:cysteinyl-tRNA synthetase
MPVSDLAAGMAPAAGAAVTSPGTSAGTAGDGALPVPGVSPFLEEVTRQSDAADAALATRDVDGAVGAVLAIDTQIHEWAADTLDSDEQDRARETLRRYVVRLGDLARNGAADPRDLIGPVVDRILDLRVQMRGAGEYALADRLRDALVEAGIEVHDTPAGSSWDLAPTAGE